LTRSRVTVFLLAFASVLLVPVTAHATPTFLSAIDVSAAGQDGFEPQVAVEPSTGNVVAVWTRSDGSNLRIESANRTPNGAWSAPTQISDEFQSASSPGISTDPSGNMLAVWTRSDGSNGRIQAAYRPAGGSFGTPVTVSASGGDANQPQVSMDTTGKAIVTWIRFDGTKTRVQAAVRSAGSGGTFGAVSTLSPAGQDAFQPQVSSGPNADANGVIVWTRSDGTNLRVQSSRRKDVVGYPRPQAAGPAYFAMVPAYNQCAPASANRNHGPALAFPSCNPPVRNSTVLTMGTPDVNTFAANGTAFVRYTPIAGNAATEADEADVKLTSTMKDVRNNPSGSDYTGSLLVRTNLQITDRNNAAETPEPATTESLPYDFPVSCVSTADTSIGGTCSLVSSVDAIVPGTILESMRTVWEINQVSVIDAGPNTTFGDSDDETFLRQGVFIP
jgi:hypothetical protein